MLLAEPGAQAMHSTDPLLDEYVPGAHRVQVCAPVWFMKYPALQGWHSDISNKPVALPCAVHEQRRSEVSARISVLAQINCKAKYLRTRNATGIARPGCIRSWRTLYASAGSRDVDVPTRRAVVTHAATCGICYGAGSTREANQRGSRASCQGTPGIGTRSAFSTDRCATIGRHCARLARQADTEIMIGAVAQATICSSGTRGTLTILHKISGQETTG